MSKNNLTWAARGFKKVSGNSEQTPESKSIEPTIKFQTFSQPKKFNGEPRGEKRKAPNNETSNPRPKIKVEKKEKKLENTEVDVKEENNEVKLVNPNKPKKPKAERKYVLFVGNLAFDTTKEDLRTFFGKAGTVKNVRIPMTKNDNKPRGFAYVEMEDHVAYEKALSLHHTFMKRRRINVECTFAGSKKSKHRMAIIKDKTLKMRFLGREGKLHTADHVKKKTKPKTVNNCKDEK